MKPSNPLGPSSLSRRRFLKQSGIRVVELSQLAFLVGCSNLSTKTRGVSSGPGQIGAPSAAELGAFTALPGSPEYEASYLGYNAAFRSIRPRYFALPHNEEQVRQALLFARGEGIPLHLRSGGHCFEDLSTGPGLVLDVRKLNEIKIDATEGTVSVGAGAKLGQVAKALSAHNLVIPTGSCSTVGVTGLTLGGGYGFVSRKLGLTCDSLLEVELLDAQGKATRASASENPDLFWALRGGGGGSYGVVTRLKFKAHACDKLSVITASVPKEKTRELLKTWQGMLGHAPDELTVVLYVGCGKDALSDPLILAQYWGDAKQARRALGPLIPMFKNPHQKIRELSPILAHEHFGGRADGPLDTVDFKSKSHYFNHKLSRDAWDDCVRYLEIPTLGSVGIILDPYQGAIARVDKDQTAFAHRDALFSIQYRADWANAQEKKLSLERLGALYNDMSRHCSGAYVNYCDKSLKNWKTAYFRDHVTKLEEIKRAFDPENVFRHAMSLEPAQSSKPPGT